MILGNEMSIKKWVQFYSSKAQYKPVRDVLWEKQKWKRGAGLDNIYYINDVVY